MTSASHKNRWVLIDAQIPGAELLIMKGTHAYNGKSPRRALSPRVAERMIAVARDVTDQRRDVALTLDDSIGQRVQVSGRGVWSSDGTAHGVFVSISDPREGPGTTPSAGAWTWDLEHGTTHWSRDLCDFYDVRAEVAGPLRIHEFLSYLTVESSIEFARLWQQACTARDGAGIGFRFAATTPRARKIRVHAYGRIHRSAESHLWRGCSVDVTDFAGVAEGAPEILDAILPELPSGVLLVEHRSLKVLKWISDRPNRRWSRVDELAKLVHPDDRAAIALGNGSAQRDSVRSRPVTVRLAAAPGRYLPFSCHVYPLGESSTGEDALALVVLHPVHSDPLCAAEFRGRKEASIG